MDDCIFCKIIEGDSPCFKVYEDELVLAFLNLYPATKGHTLIIPKKHYENIFEIDKKTLESIVEAARLLALKMQKELGIEGANLFQSNGKIAEQEIMHFHLHLIPRRTGDGFRINDAIPSNKSDLIELEEISNKIRL